MNRNRRFRYARKKPHLLRPLVVKQRQADNTKTTYPLPLGKVPVELVFDTDEEVVHQKLSSFKANVGLPLANQQAIAPRKPYSLFPAF